MDRRPEDAIVREQLGSLTEPERDALSAQLAAENSDPALIRLWRYLARPAQLAPPGNWRLWLVMAGRGFGKTRAGAEWVRALARRNRFARIALVGASLAEARAVMVEGESGLSGSIWCASHSPTGRSGFSLPAASSAGMASPCCRARMATGSSAAQP